MSKSNIISIFFVAMVAVVVGFSAWTGRGLYTKLFEFNNIFHIVNNTGEKGNIEIKFPSGESFKQEYHLGQGLSYRAQNTGEGGVHVTFNGKSLGECGYVTTSNGINIISVSSDNLAFSGLYLF